MNRVFVALLFFSLGFAQLIDYDYSASTGHLYQIEQTDSSYYTSDSLLYHLETRLSVPSSHWLSGTGSYSDVHAGDYICAGSATYETDLNAKVTGFAGYIPSYSEGPTNGPAKWQNCGPAPDCPTPDPVLVRWSDSAYNSYRDSTILAGQHLGAPYGYRSISYREIGEGVTYTDEVTDSATVMRGTSSLSGGYSSPMPILYSFGSLSGTGPSHTGTVNLNSAGDYTFVQRLDVTGAVIGAYNPHVDREDYRSYKDICTNPPSCSSQNQEYTVSNVHDSATIHVIDYSDMGVIAPTIQSVVFQGMTMEGGHYTLEPGSDIPVTINVLVPLRTSAYSWYLGFELDQANAISPFSFTPTGSGLNQCDSAPLYNGVLFAYSVPVTGTLHVPDTLPESGGNVQFRIHWQSCADQPDCGAPSGKSGLTTPYVVPYIPPQNKTLPDLVCSIEPVSLIGANASATELTPGQGVDKWRVTVTNNGPGNVTLSPVVAIELAQRLCLASIFDAWEENSSGVKWVYPSPGAGFFILPSAPSLNAGSSMTKIMNGSVYCTEEGAIGAVAMANVLHVFPALNPACAPYEMDEVTTDNNLCTWTIPCVNKTIPVNPDENCTIHPSSYYNAEIGGEYDFGLTCGDDNHECTGTVGWGITPGGSISGNQTDATATVGSNASILEITATVNNPSGENAVCHAHIFFNGTGNGGENSCHIYPTPQTGYPGSSHWFYLTCSGEGIVDGDCDNAVWSFVQGQHFVVGEAFTEADMYHALVDLNQFAANTSIIVEANVNFGDNGHQTCRGEIDVPAIPCLEYV